MTTAAHTRNAHDNGLDIYTGQDIVGGEFIGRVFRDDSDPSNSGLVVRFTDSEDEFPDTADEAAASVEYVTGCTLDANSIDEIRALVA